ncbi:MAG: GNAT family N-acetyltransferase [Haloferacaceae archaeon]
MDGDDPERVTVTGDPAPPGSDGPAPAPPDGVSLRRATPDDRVGVLRVIEGALLDVDADRVRERIAADEVLVAVTREGTVVGALVRDGEDVVAVAVRRRRRRQGIGRALVGRALRAAGRLTATFDPRVRGFYEALGFEVERVPGGDATDSGPDRLRGVRTE